jgi:hypothetical protein
VGRYGFALGAGERLLAFDAEGRDVTASRAPSPFGGAAACLPKGRRLRPPQTQFFRSGARMAHVQDRKAEASGTIISF